VTARGHAREVGSYEVRVICRAEAATGFLIAGLDVVEVGDQEEGARRLTALMEQPKVGVVLMEDDLYEGLGEELVRDLGRRVLPMVVPFPGPGRRGSLTGPEEYIVEMLRQAIGYRVRLR